MVESARSVTRTVMSMETLDLMLFRLNKESLLLQSKTEHCGVVIVSEIILLGWLRLMFGQINIFRSVVDN